MDFWCKNLRERDHLEDLGIDGRIILKCILNKGVVEWNGLICIKIGRSGNLW